MPFNPSSLATSTTQQVRWLLGGNRVDDLLTDDEILFALNLNNNNIYLAGAECADIISAHFSATSQRVVIGPFQSSDWQLKSAWDTLARHLRNLGMRHSAISAEQMIPGMSFADIEELDTQTDYPQYIFTRGMHDNPGVDDTTNSVRWE